MKEKFESSPKEPEDVVNYMVERLKHEGEGEVTEKKEKLSDQEN